MKNILLTFIFIASLSAIIETAEVEVTYPYTQKIDSIMFVGNSFFYYNNSLHNYLNQLVKNDKSIELFKQRSITINGSSLSWHPLESYLDNKNIGSFRIDTSNDNEFIKSKDTSIDAVIFMDCSLCPIHPMTKDDFHKYVAEHSETIRSKGMEPMLFMSWPYKNKPLMMQELRQEFIKASNKNNILLIPAGEAFYSFTKEYPDIDLYTQDLRHPSKEGTYLAAAVVFATIFNTAVEGNQGIKDIDPEVALKIQQVADSTVQEFFHGE
tara:strand:- start:960 stop:1760 length:801 start_codon:yes stop_codon:yes gene_type:complete